jgi:hypothetical protein
VVPGSAAALAADQVQRPFRKNTTLAGSRPRETALSAINHHDPAGFSRAFIWSALALGFSIGGFFDGILLHQVLQWHHLPGTNDQDRHGVQMTTTFVPIGTRS